MNNFLKRTLSGALFVSLIVGSIVWNKYSFLGLFSMLSGWSVFEFHKLTNQKDQVSVRPLLSVIASMLLFVSAFCFVSGTTKFPVFLIYGLFIIIVFITELYAQKQNPIHNWAYFILGQVMVALPFALLNFIAFIKDYQPLILLAVFATIWVNDTGAYVIGVTLGKHRLFERISPKKSWEGFWGGAFFSLISGYVFSLFIPEISLINWIIFSEIIVVFGTFGDLTESLLKRTVNIKDSGNIIPGHGGLLDRFDSMLLAGPAIYIFLRILFQ